MFDLTIESPIIITIFLLFSGIIIRISLVLAGQYWANTFHHLATYMLLPNIAYIITSTISNNIALSLGMIGALSIVRFRNPVKSPFELTVFFALLTIGIAAGVNIKYAILLVVLILLTFFFIKYAHSMSKKFGFSIFQISFSEGEPKNIIEIVSKNKIDNLDNNQNLASSFFFKDNNTWEYKLIFTEKENLNNLYNSIANNQDIISIKKIINT